MSYYADCIDDLIAVRNGDKPLLIVSSGKSVEAYRAVSAYVNERPTLHQETVAIDCEDGRLHMHTFVSRVAFSPMFKPIAVQAVADVFRCKEGFITRVTLQCRLGLLLGYTKGDIFDFIGTDIAMNCKCDCCGGAA